MECEKDIDLLFSKAEFCQNQEELSRLMKEIGDCFAIMKVRQCLEYKERFYALIEKL